MHVAQGGSRQVLSISKGGDSTASLVASDNINSSLNLQQITVRAVFITCSIARDVV